MGKIQPGQVLNPNGRPKGSKNEKTKQWHKFRDYMLTTGLERFQEEMDKLEGKEYITVMVNMLEYFKPKLSRQEVEVDDIYSKILITDEQQRKIAARLLQSGDAEGGGKSD